MESTRVLLFALIKGENGAVGGKLVGNGTNSRANLSEKRILTGNCVINWGFVRTLWLELVFGD